MAEVKKTLTEILIITVDISVFMWTCIKKIILPGRGRKGNLLTTLFNVFDGIIDRLNYFRDSTFKVGSLNLKKRVKQAVLLVGAVLFLLSLFEWTGDRKSTFFPEENYAAQLTNNNSGISREHAEHELSHFTNENIQCRHEILSSVIFYFFGFVPTIKKYVFVRSLLI